ncbi:hypothetical protein CXG81DRAFT_9908 [Caulochytrium protostelioides]|uniref:Flavodoxin-like domain-containing protein n=1 Tax=Caulochytrium protostelioides TaxID=1555241 RepID=A0A4P9XCF0_9FUNG|nr:hypothetical protein CXG81DRAFT_9908 [Caulochytrium protostelioides]|eukprot:RKP03127.1 hypothetical protein CXG81DRAFT_9908 [Caulochytrium protostelioides]
METVRPLVYVVFHSMWGHVKALAHAEVKGLQEAGVDVKLFRFPETLPGDVLGKMHASVDESIPEITVDDLDKPHGFLFGFGTRYGRPCAQFNTFWDKTGGLWAKGTLAGKFVGCFTSTASQHGGQETTVMSALSNFVHHGMIFAPLGFGHPNMTELGQVMGGSAWGAATIAAGDGSRQVTESELALAAYQGKNFGQLLIKHLQ